MVDNLKIIIFSIGICVASETVSSIHALVTYGRYGEANREKIAYSLTVAKFDRTT